jgi:putative DNA primase/helicase
MERLLSISGGDPQTIERKFRDPIPDVRLTTRFMLISNEIPAFPDPSGAMASRCLLLETRRSFLGAEDTNLVARLCSELPGILNWALEGLARLEARGHFIQPVAGKDALQMLTEVSSPVAAFLEECVERDPDASEDSDAVWVAYQNWCGRTGNAPTSKQVFGRDLRAAGINRLQRRGENQRRVWRYQGIRLLPSEKGWRG